MSEENVTSSVFAASGGEKKEEKASFHLNEFLEKNAVQNPGANQE